MCQIMYKFIILALLFVFAEINELECTSDPRYLLYCPCMGRLGNQIDQFYGTLYASQLFKRTLVLAPWICYMPECKFPNELKEFDEVFDIQKLSRYFSIIRINEFFQYHSQNVWPENKRFGIVFNHENILSRDCGYKDGNPMEIFWNTYNVSFTKCLVNYNGIRDISSFDKHKVVAYSGQLGEYPSDKQARDLVVPHLEFNEKLLIEASKYIEYHFYNEPFIGVHIRNGKDWIKACNFMSDSSKFMASYQCFLDENKDPLSKEICVPSVDQIIEQMNHALDFFNIKSLFISTDDLKLTKQLKLHKKHLKVLIPNETSFDSTVLNIAILSKSQHFIGNCISSFSAIVSNYRRYRNLSYSFWNVQNDLYKKTIPLEL